MKSESEEGIYSESENDDNKYVLKIKVERNRRNTLTTDIIRL